MRVFRLVKIIKSMLVLRMLLLNKLILRELLLNKLMLRVRVLLLLTLIRPSTSLGMLVVHPTF